MIFFKKNRLVGVVLLINLILISGLLGFAGVVHADSLVIIDTLGPNMIGSGNNYRWVNADTTLYAQAITVGAVGGPVTGAAVQDYYTNPNIPGHTLSIHQANPDGTIGAQIIDMEQVDTDSSYIYFAPVSGDAAVELDPAATYWIVLGRSSGGGGLVWRILNDVYDNTNGEIPGTYFRAASTDGGSTYLYDTDVSSDGTLGTGAWHFAVQLTINAVEPAPEPYHFIGGTGTTDDPYQVDSCAALQAMSENLSASYVLTGTIDCTGTKEWNGGKGFDPVGDNATPFTGRFNGAGHTITGLYIDRVDDETGQGPIDEDYVGLFGYTDGAVLENVTLANTRVRGYQYVGALVGYAENSTIDTISVNVGISPNECGTTGFCVWARWGEYGGGIAGLSDGTATSNVQVGASVKGSGTYIGGIFGSMYQGTLDHAVSQADIDGGYAIGGLVGEFEDGTIVDSSASGYVNAVYDDGYKVGNTAGGAIGGSYGGTILRVAATGNVHGYNNIGGLLGESYGTHVTDSSASGNITGEYANTGGFVGLAACASVFTRSYASGNVTGNSQVGGFAGFDGCEGPGSTFNQVYATGSIDGHDDVGGLIGISFLSTIQDAYASGDVNASMGAGGLIGTISGGTIENAYSRGMVQAGTSFHAFIGQASSDPVTTSSFYDSETARVDSSYATGRTTMLMKTRSTFTDAGWDFTEVWDMGGGNSGYPYFKWQTDMDGELSETISVTTGVAFDITQTSATLGATITDGDANAYGFFAGTASHSDGALPEITAGTTVGDATTRLSALYSRAVDDSSHETLVTVPYEYGTAISGLLCGTTYYYRPVVYRVDGSSIIQAIGFGSQRSFSTLPCDPERTRNRTTGGYLSRAVLSSKNAGTAATDQCPADQILTQNLKTGARDGRYHGYTGGIVTQAHILQIQLNRLGFGAGPVDGILGPISDGAIKRMQVFLGTKPDGYVGPITRGLLNNSCGPKGL